MDVAEEMQGEPGARPGKSPAELIRARLLKGSSWVFLGMGLGAVLGLVVNGLLARLLDHDVLGAYYLMFSLAAFGAQLATLGMDKAVVFRAAVQVNDFLPMSRRDITLFEGCGEAWRKALGEARLELNDLSFVETHDCFTIAELIEYEAMGLAPEGQGARAIVEGWTQKDGRLPVNPSGGLKAKGHPIGATGVSMHALTAMQLTGTAGDLQVKDARLGGIFNMGGAAVANYVSILERIK